MHSGEQQGGAGRSREEQGAGWSALGEVNQVELTLVASDHNGIVTTHISETSPTHKQVHSNAYMLAFRHSNPKETSPSSVSCYSLPSA